MIRTILTAANRTFDLQPLADRLGLLETTIRSSGFDGAANLLTQYGVRGEPILCGQDPVSNLLNDSAPDSVVAYVREDAVYIFRLEEDSQRVPLVRWPLEHFPGILGFLYCIQDLRYPELLPGEADDVPRPPRRAYRRPPRAYQPRPGSVAAYLLERVRERPGLLLSEAEDGWIGSKRFIRAVDRLQEEGLLRVVPGDDEPRLYPGSGDAH